jgi:hypothetical protein
LVPFAFLAFKAAAAFFLASFSSLIALAHFF